MKFCKCRHPKQAHKDGYNSSCQAIINMGQYSYPCDCREYKETY